MDWPSLSRSISKALGKPIRLVDPVPVAGGCIHAAYALRSDDGQRFFLKTNAAASIALFATEQLSLQKLAGAGEIRVPRAIAHGCSGEESWLVLEHLEFGTHGSAETMGRQLARLHRHSAERFGWHEDNFIGESAQRNPWTESWSAFFRDHRIAPQLEWNRSRGLRMARGEELLDAIPRLLADHSPQPSLLHGDLWGGNAAFLRDGTPVIFDPASYHGDRETDLAMTELFGGFDRVFHEAYRAEWPLEPGYERRRTLYNLYHVLNHALHFGGSYRHQAKRMIDALLG